MGVSSVGDAGSAPAVAEVEHDEAPAPQQEPAPASAPAADGSGFDAAKASPMVLNPQAPLLDLDRSADTQGKKKGTNDDSIGDGQTTAMRPTTVMPTLQLVGPLDQRTLTAGLSETAKTQIAALLRTDSPSASDATYAFASPSFQALDADQKNKFVDIIATCGPEAAQMLAMGCEVCGDVWSKRATDGSTVLDGLDRMAKQSGLQPYVAGVIADVVTPDRIWQGDAPTCTAATMQFELASKQPAEYTRLMTGLAVDTSVQMAGGAVLQTEPGSALKGSIDARDRRSPTEAVFQGALMEFANGSETYDLNRMQSSGNGQTHRGLNGDQIQTALSQLFGVDYQTTRISTDDEAATALKTLNTSLAPNRPVLVDLVVDDTTNHCVAFEGFSNGRVHLRDPETGTRTSISEDEFLRKAAAIHVAPPAAATSPVAVGSSGAGASAVTTGASSATATATATVADVAVALPVKMSKRLVLDWLRRLGVSPRPGATLEALRQQLAEAINDRSFAQVSLIESAIRREALQTGRP